MRALYSVQLSEHFWAREFRCKGEIEARPCACHGAISVDQELIDVLEAFRAVYGMPIIITSGFRCDPYNESIGGHPASYHRVGMAADITNTMIRKDLERAAMQIGEVLEDVIGKGNGNVIAYPNRGFIHCDVGRRVATALVRIKND